MDTVLSRFMTMDSDGNRVEVIERIERSPDPVPRFRYYQTEDGRSVSHDGNGMFLIGDTMTTLVRSP